MRLRPKGYVDDAVMRQAEPFASVHAMNRTCGNHTAPELRLCTSSMPSSCDCRGSHTAVGSENLMAAAAGTKPNFWTRALGVAKDNRAIDAFCAAKLKTAATFGFPQYLRARCR